MNYSTQKIGTVFNFTKKKILARALYGILLCFWAVTASAQTNLPIEIWVSPFGSGGGAGTPDNPYSTPDADSFFNLIHDQGPVYTTNIVDETNLVIYTNTLIIPEYSTIHLMPGTFQVRLGYDSNSMPRTPITMKKGWKLRGAGMDATIVQLVPNSETLFGTGTKIQVIGGTAVTGSPGTDQTTVPLLYAEVSDLTVDCNLQNQTGQTVAAVVFSGSHNKISRVKAINWGSEQAGVECFLFNNQPTGYLSATESEDGLIEDCVAVQPAPVVDACDTIAFCTGSYAGDTRHAAWKIRGCLVRDVNGSQVGGFTAFGPSNDSELSDCVAFDLTGRANAAYNDTVDSHDIVYRNNRFINCDVGLDYNGSGSNVTNLTFLDNVIISTNAGANGIALYMPSNTMTGVRVEGNVVRLTGAGSSAGLEIDGLITFSADNNVLDAESRDFFTSGLDYTNFTCLSFKNNVNMRGQPLTVGDGANDFSARSVMTGFYDDQYTFTPTSSGWWKVAPRGHLGARIELWSWPTWLDADFDYEQPGGYAAGGVLSVDFNDTDYSGGINPVPDVRTTSYSDGSDAFEAYIDASQVGSPITVRLSGMFRGILSGFVPSQPTATPTSTLELPVGPGIRTTGPIYAGLSGGGVQQITDSSGHIEATALNMVEPAQGGLGQNASGVAADQFPYTTSTGTFGFGTLTSYTLGLLNSANAAAAQSTLQLVPGTQVQPYSSELTALASDSVTSTEFSYVSGVTSSIQNQLNTLSASGPQKIYQTADQSIGTTAANVTGLSFPVAANKDYAFEFTVVVTNSGTGKGYELGFTGPSAPVELTAKMEVPSSNSNLGSAGTAYGVNSYGTFVGPTSAGPGTARVIATISGTFRNGANAGTFTVQGQSVGSSSTVTIKQGSWGYYWKLN